MNTFGLKCYQCANGVGDKCNDKFDSKSNGTRKVDSTSGYCWVCNHIASISLFYVYLLFRK